MPPTVNDMPMHSPGSGKSACSSSKSRRRSSHGNLKSKSGGGASFLPCSPSGSSTCGAECWDVAGKESSHATNFAPSSSCSEQKDETYNVFSGVDEFQDIDECMRQKKYSFFQSDDGRPAELYRTDLIHKVKSGEGECDTDSSDDEYEGVAHVKVRENWREEWNAGVQVPVAPKSMVNFECAPCDLRLEKPMSRRDWVLPKKRIATRKKRYVTSEEFDIAKPIQSRSYQGDLLDKKWLQRYNDIRERLSLPSISMSEFLDLINAMEIDCYMNIHKELLALLNSPAANHIDEDAACDICRLKDCEQDDDMVFCDGCNMCVHLSCYGLSTVPTDQWLCNRCKICTGQMPPCVLCPTMGGAVKLTNKMNVWAHVVCALYIPEIRFGNVESREPITAIDEIPEERWQLKCSICDTRKGACIQCSVKSCTTAFHVSCCQRRGLEMRIEQEPLEDSVKFITLCEKHSFKAALADDQLAGEIRRIEGKTKPTDDSEVVKSADLCRLEKQFYLYVNKEEVAHRYDANLRVVSDVYEYWRLKRLSRDGKYLIPNAHDYIEIETSEVDNTFYMLHSVFARMKHAFERYLKDLDMFRNLSNMSLKREKLKQEMLSLESDVISKMGEMLGMTPTGPNCVPLSQRVLDGLLATMTEMLTYSERMSAKLRKHASVSPPNVPLHNPSPSSLETPTDTRLKRNGEMKTSTPTKKSPSSNGSLKEQKDEMRSKSNRRRSKPNDRSETTTPKTSKVSPKVTVSSPVTKRKRCRTSLNGFVPETSKRLRERNTLSPLARRYGLV